MDNLKYFNILLDKSGKIYALKLVDNEETEEVLIPYTYHGIFSGKNLDEAITKAREKIKEISAHTN